MISIENNYRVSNCPVCNSPDIKKTGDLNYTGKVEFSSHRLNLSCVPEIWKCGNCGSFFTQNSIKPDVAENLYATGDGSKRWTSENFNENKTNKVITCLDKYLAKKDIKVLDVGSNSGDFLDYAKKNGVKTYGLELSRQSCDILKSKGHIPFRTSKEITEKFDLITAFDVFEHIYDPMGFLSFIHGILNKDGIFIILTGNPGSLPARLSKEKWWYFNYPEHFIFPVPSFFKNLKDFRVIETRNVFASVIHEESGLLFGIKNFIRIILSKNYSGRPAIIPDHQLVVLQRV